VLGGLVGLVFAVVGAGILWMSGHPAGWFVGGIGSVVATACCLIVVLGRRYYFDRQTAVWWSRRFGRGRHYPLDRIRAVQLIHGGWYGGDDRPGFNTYQFNLVLDDPAESRMNVTNAANWDATWGMASALAEFLGVPLHDAVSQA
jgi:hypothetical protein